MTHPFSKAAVEAAMQAFAAKQFHEGMTDNNPFASAMDAAISAAFDHARGEGRLTEGKHMAAGPHGAGHTHLGSNDFWRGDFKFTIIKDAGE